MFFDIYDEIYLYFIAKDKMTFFRTFVLSLKIFWNLSLAALILYIPYTIIHLISN
jgi:hypothetical protein